MFRDHQSRPPYSADNDVLADRLRTGETMIEAEPDANRRLELEHYWIRLLHDYECAVDRECRDQDKAGIMMRAGR